MGSLSFSSITARTGTVNLDTINGGSAPTDWALWDGGSPPTPTQTKNGGGGTIGLALYQGNGSFSNITGDGTVTWSNGAPTASGSTTGDVFNSTFTSAFGVTFTLPADTTPRIAWFLIGSFNTSTLSVSASLSDGSAASILDTTSLVGASSSFNPFLVAILYTANSASQTLTVNFFNQAASPQTATVQAAAYATSGPIPTLNQENYRWRNDDGSESTATWIAAEATGITAPVSQNTRLRLQLDSAHDYPSTAYQLECKLGAGSYSKVAAVATTVFGVPTFKSAGTGVSGTGAITVTMPSSFAAGDLLVMCVETANQAVATAPSGWTQDTSSPQGTGTAANVVATRLSVYYKIATGSETGINIGDAGDHTFGITFAIAGTHQTTPVHLTAGTVVAAASTSVSCPGGTTTAANCLILNLVSNGTDTATAQGSAWANSNLSSVTERIDQNVAAGNGGGITVVSGGLATAGAIGTTTGTLATSSVQGLITLAIQPPASVANDIYINPSANIAASAATSTTAQLTAPSGKTTSNLTAGFISDDTNPLPVVDIASDNYTELEWCLIGASGLTGGNVYSFRVTANGVAIDTYTTVPTWTISGSDTLFAQSCM